MKTGKNLDFSRNAYVFGLLLLVATYTSCTHSSSGDPFAAIKFNPFDQDLGKRIEAYNITTAPNNANSKSGNPALYIDFSSGDVPPKNLAIVK